MKGSPQGSVREELGKSEPGISGEKWDVKKEAEMALKGAVGEDKGGTQAWQGKGWGMNVSGSALHCLGWAGEANSSSTGKLHCL